MPPPKAPAAQRVTLVPALSVHVGVSTGKSESSKHEIPPPALVRVPVQKHRSMRVFE